MLRKLLTVTGIGLGAAMWRAIRDEPTADAAVPVLPAAWLNAVLEPLVAADVERWRRFRGALVHSYETDGRHWELRLARGGPWETRTLRTWWRGDEADTVPELLGYLTITTLSAAAIDGPNRIGEQQRFRAALELTQTLDDRNQALLRLATEAGRAPETRHEASAPAPPSDLTSPPPTAPEPPPAGWSGFPPPLSTADVRPELPLSILAGATIFIGGANDLVGEPAEFLLSGSSTGPTPVKFVVRVRADGGPLNDDYPDLADHSDWNAASALDRDYVVTDWSLTGDKLRLSGPEWIFVLTGPNLQVRAEQLPT